MKKILSLLLCCSLLFCTVSLARAEIHYASPADALGQDMPDFTVTTLDGGQFTLSEALKEKELVLVNFWATWCPPCKLEFPFMQEAYSQYQDRVGLIVMSVENADSLEVLSAFAQDRNLSFPMGRDENGLNELFSVTAIPTTMLVDRFGKIVYAGSGSLLDTNLFATLFDAFLGEDYTESKVMENEVEFETGRYVIIFVDEDLKPVPGCVVTFSTDTECATLTSGETGAAVYTGEPASYRVKLLQVPKGFQLEESEFETNPSGDIGILQLRKAE